MRDSTRDALILGGAGILAYYLLKKEPLESECHRISKLYYGTPGNIDSIERGVDTAVDKNMLSPDCSYDACYMSKPRITSDDPGYWTVYVPHNPSCHLGSRHRSHWTSKDKAIVA